jgi:hypothetical protein
MKAVAIIADNIIFFIDTILIFHPIGKWLCN